MSHAREVSTGLNEFSADLFNRMHDVVHLVEQYRDEIQQLRGLLSRIKHPKLPQQSFSAAIMGYRQFQVSGVTQINRWEYAWTEVNFFPSSKSFIRRFGGAHSGIEQIETEGVFARPAYNAFEWGNASNATGIVAGGINTDGDDWPEPRDTNDDDINDQGFYLQPISADIYVQPDLGVWTGEPAQYPVEVFTTNINAAPVVRMFIDRDSTNTARYIFYQTNHVDGRCHSNP